MRARFPFELLAVAAVAVVLWLLFYPGLLTGDSCNQIRQAEEHNFHDFHTPLMSIVLWLFLDSFGLKGLMLIQCFAGCFGVYGLLAEGLEMFRPGAWSPARRGLTALAGFLLLLVPPSPLMFWLMTFTKDAWCMILLLDLGACTLYLWRRGAELEPGPFAACVALFILLTELVLLSRHNAIVVLPALMWCLWLVLRQRQVSRLVAAALPLMLIPLHIASAEGLNRAFSVARMHPENQVMAMDLVGFCVLDDRFLDEFPYTRSQLNGERYRTEYVFGDVIPLVWETERPTVVDPEYVFTKLGFPRDPHRDEQLRAEYRHAVLHHPLTLLRVKWLAFRPLLDEYNYRHCTPEELPGERYLNPRAEGIRTELFALDKSLAVHWWPHWLVSAHWPWLLVNAVGLIAAALAAWRDAAPRFWLLAAWLLASLLYYSSYFLATLGREFRFLYPATALVQVMTVAFLLALVLGRRSAPAPVASPSPESP